MNLGHNVFFNEGHPEPDCAAKIAELKDQFDKLLDKVEYFINYSNKISDNMNSDIKVVAISSAQRAEILYKNRRRRETLFGFDIFGEPAWDILLDLFIASARSKHVSVTSACIGAAVPPTTALRWLSALETCGLILRENDVHDARRSNVRLSEKGRKLMDQYLADV
jgi:predicted transcriptional regulator